jgi:hypothetical protein
MQNDVKVLKKSMSPNRSPGKTQIHSANTTQMMQRRS